jgi:hypothetical protein
MSFTPWRPHSPVRQAGRLTVGRVLLLTQSKYDLLQDIV